MKIKPKVKKYADGGKNDSKYQNWRSKLPKNLQYEGDYDLRGFYNENPNFNVNDPDQHLTDRFKLPNHPTFSNESKYFNTIQPQILNQAGHWQETDSSFNYIPYNTMYKDTLIEKKQNGGSVGEWEIVEKDDLPKAGNGYKWSDDLEPGTVTRKQNVGDINYNWNNSNQKPDYSITSTENNNIHGNDYIDPTKWLKTSLDVASLFNYPLSVVGAAKDTYEGDYLGAGLGLIPVLGKAGLHGSTWGKAYTIMRNNGVPEKIAQGVKKYGKNAVITSSKAAQGYDFTQDMQEKQNGGKAKSGWQIIG